ncbi:MAG: hypothetical protein WCE63_12530 [Acidobacteriaceae bacterium]
MKGIESRLVLAANYHSDYSQGCNAIPRTMTGRERAQASRVYARCGGGHALVGTDNRARPDTGLDEFNRAAALRAHDILRGVDLLLARRINIGMSLATPPI